MSDHPTRRDVLRAAGAAIALGGLPATSSSGPILPPPAPPPVEPPWRVALRRKIRRAYRDFATGSADGYVVTMPDGRTGFHAFAEVATRWIALPRGLDLPSTPAMGAINREEFCGAAPGHLRLDALDFRALPKSGPPGEGAELTEFEVKAHFALCPRDWNHLLDAAGAWRPVLVDGLPPCRYADFGRLLA